MKERKEGRIGRMYSNAEGAGQRNPSGGGEGERVKESGASLKGIRGGGDVEDDTTQVDRVALLACRTNEGRKVSVSGKISGHRSAARLSVPSM